MDDDLRTELLFVELSPGMYDRLAYYSKEHSVPPTQLAAFILDRWLVIEMQHDGICEVPKE